MPIYCPPPTPDEIYHHGILGQRWGKKNGPPYPLGASDHSAAERKAGWKKSLDGEYNKSDARRATIEGGLIGRAIYKKNHKNDSFQSQKPMSKKEIKEATKQANKEAQVKSHAEYKKATDYADKHGLDYDDLVFDTSVDEVVSNFGLDKKTAQHVVEYSRLTAIAEAKEHEYYSEAKSKVDKMISDRTPKMKINKTDTKITRQVKHDYNDLTDSEFFKKYQTSKKTYAKRVNKYGDPYKHRVNGG